jgi:ankyrin repeat protein
MKDLYEAVRAHDAARVEALVEADPSLAIFAAVMQRDVRGDTQTGTARLEELLAGNRSLVLAVSPDGWTPLHLAAFFGNESAARVLLNKGASPAERSTNAMENLPLHAAAAGRHANLVKLLIEHGSPVGARQHGGWTALHAAAQNGDVAMAEILVSAGADVSARAENNQCAMDLALTKGHRQMVEFLEAHGARL